MANQMVFFVVVIVEVEGQNPRSFDPVSSFEKDIIHLTVYCSHDFTSTVTYWYLFYVGKRNRFCEDLRKRRLVFDLVRAESAVFCTV